MGSILPSRAGFRQSGAREVRFCALRGKSRCAEARFRALAHRKCLLRPSNACRCAPLWRGCRRGCDGGVREALWRRNERCYGTLMGKDFPERKGLFQKKLLSLHCNRRRPVFGRRLLFSRAAGRGEGTGNRREMDESRRKNLRETDK